MKWADINTPAMKAKVRELALSGLSPGDIHDRLNFPWWVSLERVRRMAGKLPRRLSKGISSADPGRKCWVGTI
jgi:hypothetical protein